MRVPDEQPTIADALVELAGAGLIEISDSGRYEETVAINVNAGQTVEIRAANNCRPTLILGGELQLRGGKTPKSGSTGC